MSTDYAALANTIKIEDITSNELNREILHKLKNNDESFDELWICKEGEGFGTDDYDDHHQHYIPSGAEDELGWLGYYIGQNRMLQTLHFCSTFDFIEDGKIFYMLGPFLKNNYYLFEFQIEDCEFGSVGIRQLSSAIGSCNRSLTSFSLSSNRMGDGQLVDIIAALGVHPQLEQLDLSYMDVGITECTALSTLLRHTTTNLQRLNLNGNIGGIDDECIGILTQPISCSKLEELTLSSKRSITIRGWKKLSTLLEMPDCKLEKLSIDHCSIGDEGALVFANALANNNQLQYLNLGSNQLITIKGWKAVSTLLEMPCTNLKSLGVSYNNNIGDEGALVFANALKNNSTLKTLEMQGCGVSAKGWWAPFSKLLCDTSSVNSTYLSNHTLEHLSYRGIDVGAQVGIVHSLATNHEMEDKHQVAMVKILQNHSHFDMEPFFEWEFSVLPLMINWVEKVGALVHDSFEEKIKRMNLSIVYDFIREFPMLYVESVTRKEIAKYTALEEELQGDES